MFLAAYIIGFLVSWYLVAAMMFCYSQGRFPTIAAQSVREDLGLSIAMGLLYSVFWPIGLPVAYLITGFAEFGIRRKTLADSQPFQIRKP